MFKYKVKIRRSVGPLDERAKLVDGNEYYFSARHYIQGGHADGEIKMVPVDSAYPENDPDFLAMGDLELVD